MTRARVLGRPRSEKSREAILEAALALLVDRGWAGFALEAVAAAAGTGKTTIYRWWNSKAALAVESFLHSTEVALRLPDTGSAEDDFRGQILELGRALRGPRGRAFAALLGASRTDPVLGAALGEGWLEPRKRWGFDRMRRAYAENELHVGVEPGPALALLYGPVYAPLLFGGELPDEAELNALLALSCRAIFRPASEPQAAR